VFKPCPDSNPSDIAVVLIAVFALSDHMRTLPNAPIVRKHDTRPVGNHASVLNTCLLFLGYKLCRQMLYMQQRCAIEQSLSTSPALSRMFSMAAIIGPYWIPLSLLTQAIHFSFSPTHVTLPLVFRWTVFLHSSGVIRRAGRLSSLIIISLPKFIFRRNTAFTSAQSQVQRNPGIGTHFAGHLFRNSSN